MAFLFKVLGMYDSTFSIWATFARYLIKFNFSALALRNLAVNNFHHPKYLINKIFWSFTSIQYNMLLSMIFDLQE